jgi:hypothetical protein
MTKLNPSRDYASKLAEDIGFTVVSNSIYRDARYLDLKCSAPTSSQQALLNKWKDDERTALAAVGFIPDYGQKFTGNIRNGEFYIRVRLTNDKNPHARISTPPVPKVRELPESVATYITKDLGWGLDKVVEHRMVYGDETLYVVLMENNSKKNTQRWVVAFVGNYVARRPLGPYEEAYEGNAMRVSWNCLYDAEPWEHSVERFRNAPYKLFNG